MSRIDLLAVRYPDAPILKMVYPALKRLTDVPLSETIYRWEAESLVGRIVGYSTKEALIGVFPWIMRNKHEWVGSIILF